MLKATLNGKYRKSTGQVVYTYTVAGTAKELAAYKAAQADAIGKAVEDLTLSASGQPLFWFVPNLAQGRVAQKTFNLTITVNNRIVIDDTNESVAMDIEDAAQIRAARNAKLGEHAAMVMLGQASNTRTVAPAAPAEKPAEPLEPAADEVDAAAALLQNAGAGAEGEEDLGT